jgi:hypothetical protein
VHIFKEYCGYTALFVSFFTPEYASISVRPTLSVLS